MDLFDDEMFEDEPAPEPKPPRQPRRRRLSGETAKRVLVVLPWIVFYVAFNYGGRAEIVDAARSFQGESEEEFRRHLYAPEMHDPDLLIRTSGEQRISNYLLWQCAYAELVFRDELWPDFTREAFEESLGEFEARKRRFGARI